MLDYPDTLRGQLELACSTLQAKVADKPTYKKLPKIEQNAMVKSIKELKYIIEEESAKWLDDTHLED